jgi:chemotaxis signal transduction protein
MLCLLLNAGLDKYALPVERVETVVPFARLKHVPGAPRSVAGILNFHGEQVAVIDCGELLAGQPCAAKTETRIILCPVEFAGKTRRIGLLGEQISQMHRFAESDFKPVAARAGEPACAGPVAPLDGLLVQLLHPEKAIQADALDALLAGNES